MQAEIQADPQEKLGPVFPSKTTNCSAPAAGDVHLENICGQPEQQMKGQECNASPQTKPEDNRGQAEQLREPVQAFGWSAWSKHENILGAGTPTTQQNESYLKLTNQNLNIFEKRKSIQKCFKTTREFLPRNGLFSLVESRDYGVASSSRKIKRKESKNLRAEPAKVEHQEKGPMQHSKPDKTEKTLKTLFFKIFLKEI